jgi:hemerythrin superfamily protein
MSITLEDPKRTAIAVKLADMKATQNVLIANEQALIQACQDQEISSRLENFLKDDQKNLGIIDTVIVQYGIKAEPKPSVQKNIEEVGIMMQDSNISLFDKVAKHELLTHTQAISGLLVHKAGQVVGEDIALDHAKVNTLLDQIKATNNPQKLEEYFGQVYQDLSAHSEAEEAVVYPVMRFYYADIQHLYDKQAAMKQLLEQIKAMNCEDTVAFKAAIEGLMSAITAHVSEEEKDIFPLIRHSFSNEQQEKLAADFITAKSKIQDQRLAVAS